MGLVSYIKNLYYNSRLNKAETLLVKGRSSEAERILTDLIGKQPLAAPKLASYYHSLFQSADAIQTAKLFGQAAEIEGKCGQIYDATAYNEVLNKFAAEIIQRAHELFKSASFEDCSIILDSVNKTKCQSQESFSLWCESEANIVLHKIDVTEFGNKDFLPLIDAIKIVWQNGKNVPNVKSTAILFCNKFIESNRCYVAAVILGIINDNRYHKECLKLIEHVILGNDSEIDERTIKDVVANYGKQLVLSQDIPSGQATFIFDKCWVRSFNSVFVMDTLSDGIDPSLKDQIVSWIIVNHSSYLTNSELYTKLLKWISESYSLERSIELYEKIYSLGYDVEIYYIDKVHSLGETLPYESRVSLLDNAQNRYPKSKIIIDDKLTCAKWYEGQDDNIRAISIADSIISNCKEAKIVKAKALCNLANKDSEVNISEQYADQAISELENLTLPEVDDVRLYICQTYVNIAEIYYSATNCEKAYQILHKLSKQGYTPAVSSIIEYRLLEVKGCSEFITKRDTADKAISEVAIYGSSTTLSCPSFYDLWSEKIESTIEIAKGKEHRSAVKDFEKLISEVQSVGFDNAYVTEKVETLRKCIIERKYIIARDLEKAQNYTDAITVYKEINTLENKRTPTLSALRFILCKLKSETSEQILEHKEKIYSLLNNAAKAYKAEIEDIAYRFALILLKAGEDNEALSVVTEFIPEENFLKKACEQGALIKAQAKLEDFNQKLDSVKNNTLSSDDAIYFINHMREYADIIKPILNLPLRRLSGYRTKLKNYAICKLFEEEKFDVAFEKMIKEHSDYLEDLTALRNIALLCLNVAESNQFTQQNYRDVIAVWLTAIYQEKLFVKSLDYTSWDNQYKFTLQNAFGHYDEYDYDDLPDNVTFEDPEENVIVSIREVQRSLLDRFEASISDNQAYHTFFTFQKNAMDALIDLNMDRKCPIVAPHLFNNNDDVREEITEAFSVELDGQYANWEDVLSVGTMYQMTDSIYLEYKVAKELFENLKESITNKNNVHYFTSSNVLKVKKFEKLYSTLISYITSKISALKSDDKAMFNSNFNFYINVCESIKDNSISFGFSNYVMPHVVKEVNEKRMKIAEASHYILSIYLLDTNNTKVRDNLKTLFEMLVRGNTTAEKQAASTVLNKVSGYSASFYKELKKEYEEAQVESELNDIFKKVKNHSITTLSALKSVHNLYKANSSNSNVCTVLAQLCVVCIDEYVIGDKSGKYDVKSILNLIKANKSAEFKKHSKVFSDRYNAIWKQLPSDIKDLLRLGFSLSGQTLNSKGEALKEGLNLLKDFGGINNTGGLGGLFGIPNLDDLPF